MSIDPDQNLPPTIEEPKVPVIYPDLQNTPRPLKLDSRTEEDKKRFKDDSEKILKNHPHIEKIKKHSDFGKEVITITTSYKITGFTPKPKVRMEIGSNTDRIQRIELICPCATCGHETVYDCENNNCSCCHEVCT